MKNAPDPQSSSVDPKKSPNPTVRTGRWDGLGQHVRGYSDPGGDVTPVANGSGHQFGAGGSLFGPDEDVPRGAVKSGRPRGERQPRQDTPGIETKGATGNMPGNTPAVNGRPGSSSRKGR